MGVGQLVNDRFTEYLDKDELFIGCHTKTPPVGACLRTGAH